MSELLYNSETGKYETKDPLTGERTVVPTLDELEAQQGQWQDTTMAERSAMRVLPYKIEERLAAEREQQEYARALAAGEGAGDNRPVFAQNPGQFLGDLTKISLNMPLGLATDLADIATTGLKAGPGQVVGIVSDLAQGQNPFTPERYQQRMLGAIDESQNWLTRTRREWLRPETQAGQFVSNILRLATPSKLLTAPLKAVGVLKNLDKVTDVAKFASPEALKAVGLVDNVTPGARGAIKAIENAPNRRIPFKVVAEAAKRDTGALAVKNRWQGLETQVATMKASLGIGAPRKQWIKSAAEFIGWDLFMAYNVAGEGDEELDETLGDVLQDWTGIGNPLATDWTDNALTLKLKQMADAAIGGTIVGGAIDLFRVQRYARNFSRATAVEQRKILELFDRQAEDIGVRITNAYDRPMLPTSNINLRAIDAEVVEEPRPAWEQAMDYYSRRTRAQRARTLPGQEPAGLLRGAGMGEPGPSTPPAAAVEAPTQGSGVPSPATPREEPPAVPPPGWPEQVTPEAFVSIASELFSMATGPQLDEAIETLGELLPRRRVDLTTFVQDMGVTPNDLNLLPAPQQFVVNRMLRQGVAEGWVEFDSNFNPVVRMLRAQEMDLADLDAEAARDFDEVLRLRRMQEENQNNLLMQLLDRPRMAEPAGALAERPQIDLQQEYERFSGEQPDGTIDEFREWLQRQDQLEEVLAPSADARVGDVPEEAVAVDAEVVEPEATPPPRARRRGIAKGMAEDLDALMGSVGRMVRDTDEFTQRGLKRLDEREGILADQLNQQIVEAEQRAQLSRQRSDMALARAAQDEVDEVSPALAGDTVLDLSGYTPIDPGAPAKVVAARIEELKPLVKNPQDAERLRWAQENLLTDRKRESRLAKRAEYEAAAAAAGRQEPSDIPADLSKLSNKQKNAVMDAFQANPGLRQLWPDRKFVAPWEEEKWARFGAAKWGDDDFAVFDVAQGEGARPIDGRTYPTKQAAQRAADRVNDQGLKQARSIVEEVLSSSGGGTPPKPPKALQELEADEVARQAVAEIDRATREESVVEPLDDFMRQIEENGEICFP